MATLQQIRDKVKTKLDEVSNSHFTDATLNSLINEAIEFLAVYIEYPRDIVQVQAEQGVGKYNLLSDTLSVRTAYFGNPSLEGDLKKLKITTEETLSELHPNWMEETTQSQDEPEWFIVLNRSQFFVYPTPNATSSASGKYILLNYNYSPAALTSDSQEPDLPVPYHNIIQYYILHLCYIALKDKEMAATMLNDFLGKVKLIKPMLTKEVDVNKRFDWVTGDGNNDYADGIIP